MQASIEASEVGKEYSFSAKPDLRITAQIQHRFANANTALKSLLLEYKIKLTLHSTKKHQYKKTFVKPTSRFSLRDIRV
jgi:hypothetical protein